MTGGPDRGLEPSAARLAAPTAPPPPPALALRAHTPLLPTCSAPLHSFAAPQIITPFNIYFNAKLIWQQHEYWRLFTNFFYFGSLGAEAGSCGVPFDRCRSCSSA